MLYWEIDLLLFIYEETSLLVRLVADFNRLRNCSDLEHSK
jgi:hypothetical protein